MLKGCAHMSVEFLDMFRIRSPSPFQLHVCKPTVIFDFCVISSLKFYFCCMMMVTIFTVDGRFYCYGLYHIKRSNGPSFAI